MKPHPALTCVTTFMLTICSSLAAPVDPARFDHPVRLACVGDSITFGAGVKPRNTMAYPAQLIDLHAALSPHKNLFPDTVHATAAGATVIAKTVYRSLTGKQASAKVPEG